MKAVNMWRLPRLRSLECMVWLMSLIVLISMVYSIQKMSVLYMKKDAHDEAAILPAQPPDRKVLSIHKGVPHNDDIKHHHFKRSAHVKPELVRLMPETNESQSSTETIPDFHQKVPKKEISNQNRNDDDDDNLNYVADDEIKQARMLDELDGFNYFVEWEDEDKVKNAHLPPVRHTYLKELEIGRRIRNHEPINEMLLLQGAQQALQLNPVVPPALPASPAKLPSPAKPAEGDAKSNILFEHLLSQKTKVESSEKTGRKSRKRGKGRRKVYASMMGRLGNNMFQLASLYGIAKVANRIPVIEYNSNILDVFHSNMTQHIHTDIFPPNVTTLHEEQSGIFTPVMFELPARSVQICCYLQSWKYFRNHNKEIKQLFTLKSWVTIRADAILHAEAHKYRTKMKMNAESQLLTFVGIHVRRGDLMEQEHMARGYRAASLSYLHKAMDHSRQRHPSIFFIVTSDDTAWCEKYLSKHTDVSIVSGNDAIVDLGVLIACNHTIITVGTFGWWAAWLSGGETTYYSNWATPGTEISQSYNRDDYFPPHWKSIGD